MLKSDSTVKIMASQYISLQLCVSAFAENTKNNKYIAHRSGRDLQRAATRFGFQSRGRRAAGQHAYAHSVVPFDTYRHYLRQVREVQSTALAGQSTCSIRTRTVGVSDPSRRVLGGGILSVRTAMPEEIMVANRLIRWIEADTLQDSENLLGADRGTHGTRPLGSWQGKAEEMSIFHGRPALERKERTCVASDKLS
jgi:hypothetical protein